MSLGGKENRDPTVDAALEVLKRPRIQTPLPALRGSGVAAAGTTPYEDYLRTWGNVAPEVTTASAVAATPPADGGPDGYSDSSTNPAWDAMSMSEKAAYYADNPTAGKIGRVFGDAFSNTPYGMMQNYFDPGIQTQTDAIMAGVDPTGWQFSERNNDGIFGTQIGGTLSFPELSPENFGPYAFPAETPVVANPMGQLSTATPTVPLYTTVNLSRGPVADAFGGAGPYVGSVGIDAFGGAGPYVGSVGIDAFGGAGPYVDNIGLDAFGGAGPYVDNIGLDAFGGAGPSVGSVGIDAFGGAGPYVDNIGLDAFGGAGPYVGSVGIDAFGGAGPSVDTGSASIDAFGGAGPSVDTVGIDAFGGAGPSVDSGGGGGGKIICTAMNHAYGFGSFRNAIWIAYADKHLTKAHEVGYHTLFLPLVDFGFKQGDGKLNMAVRKVLEWGTRHRSTDLRAELRNTKRDTTGRIIRFIFEPLCYAVGKLKGY